MNTLRLLYSATESLGGKEATLDAVTVERVLMGIMTWLEINQFTLERSLTSVLLVGRAGARIHPLLSINEPTSARNQHPNGAWSLWVLQGRHSLLRQRWDKGKDSQATVRSLAGNVRHNPKHYREQSDNAAVQWGNSSWMQVLCHDEIMLRRSLMKEKEVQGRGNLEALRKRRGKKKEQGEWNQLASKWGF